MNAVALYQICAMLPNTAWITLHFKHGMVYSGQVSDVPNRYCKYPVIKMTPISNMHIIIYIV